MKINTLEIWECNIYIYIYRKNDSLNYKINPLDRAYENRK